MLSNAADGQSQSSRLFASEAGAQDANDERSDFNENEHSDELF